MHEPLIVALCATAGALLAPLAACLPGMLVYGGTILFVLQTTTGGSGAALWRLSLGTGLVVGYAMLNTLPAVLLCAPDESALLAEEPGRRSLARGHGYEGVMLTATGGLAGLFAMVLLAGPLAPRVLPSLHAVIFPHAGWIVWCLIGFLLMTEPGARKTAGRWNAWWAGTGAQCAGWLTFCLAGFLGMILFHRSPLPSATPLESFVPALIGLFALPQVVLHAAQPPAVPQQTLACRTRPYFCADAASTRALLRDCMAGIVGGGFAACVPGLTGAAGGFLARETTTQNRRASQFLAQGAAKLVYYTGGLVLVLAPGLHRSATHDPFFPHPARLAVGHDEYAMLLGAVAIAGAVSFCLVSPLARGILFLICRVGYRTLMVAMGGMMGGIVAAQSGLTGLLILLTGLGIGLFPILFGGRRVHCLGVILVPMACSLSEWGTFIADWLGLL